MRTVGAPSSLTLWLSIFISGGGPLKADGCWSFHLSNTQQEVQLQSGTGSLQTVDTNQPVGSFPYCTLQRNHATWSHHLLFVQFLDWFTFYHYEDITFNISMVVTPPFCFWIKYLIRYSLNESIAGTVPYVKSV